MAKAINILILILFTAAGLLTVSLFDVHAKEILSIPQRNLRRSFDKFSLEFSVFHKQAVHGMVVVSFVNKEYLTFLANYLCNYSQFQAQKHLFEGLVIVALDEETNDFLQRVKAPVFYNAHFWKGTDNSKPFRTEHRHSTGRYQTFIERRSTFIYLLLRTTDLIILLSDVDAVLVKSPFSYFHFLSEVYPTCDYFWTADAPHWRIDFVQALMKEVSFVFNGGFYVVRSNRTPVIKFMKDWLLQERILGNRHPSKEQIALRKILHEKYENATVSALMDASGLLNHLHPPSSAENLPHFCLLSDWQKFPHYKEGKNYTKTFLDYSGLMMYHANGLHHNKIQRLKSYHAWTLLLQDDTWSCRTQSLSFQLPLSRLDLQL